LSTFTFLKVAKPLLAQEILDNIDKDMKIWMMIINIIIIISQE
jgi:hypothetical protein